MKIGLLGYIYGRGGIQTHTHYLAEGLISLGEEVVVITPPKVHKNNRDTPKGRRYEIVEYDWSTILFGKELPRLDVIVVTGIGWKAMALALIACNSARKIFFEVMSGNRHCLFDPRLLVHAGFDDVVGQGRPVELQFRKDFRWIKPSITIPALSAPIELSEQSGKTAKHGEISNSGVRFAYFGRLAAHKNVHFLIENWRGYAPKHSTLDIWGDGDQKDRLNKLIKTECCENSVFLRGSYPEGHRYFELLRQYDLILLPTIGDEGAPLVLLESMACGVPFVANGVGGISDYANADCGITSGDIAEFIPELRKMVCKIEKQEIDSNRLRLHYEKFFSTQHLVKKWHDFLTDSKNSDSL